MINSDFWKGKKVLVTGHTGFKGAWLSIWLNEMGASVIGYSLDPYTEKDLFCLSNLKSKINHNIGDIRDSKLLNSIFDRLKPEIVFHLAAQPLVRKSYEIPIETYEINLMGTLNVLEAIRASKSCKIGIMITTDKCYENKEQFWGYRENDPMGGFDPYSSSKGATEIAINSWRQSFFNPKSFSKHGKAIASVRAGNVIGGGDWNLDRIIPDCIRSIEKDKAIEIRSPKSIRPWEHVLEPLCGYLLLAEKMHIDPIYYSEGWNFGPDSDSFITVWNLAKKIINLYGKGIILDKSNDGDLHEASLLTLDITKAKYKLGWKPKLSIQDTVKMTIDWYKSYMTKDVYDLCKDQIKYFLEK